MQEWKTGLVVSLQATPDGDASEKPLVGVLTPRTRQNTEGPRLFVADRFFGDVVQAAHLAAQAGDHFLLRAHSGTVVQADLSRPGQSGTDADGRRYVEAWAGSAASITSAAATSAGFTWSDRRKRTIWSW